MAAVWLYPMCVCVHLCVCEGGWGGWVSACILGGQAGGWIGGWMGNKRACVEGGSLGVRAFELMGSWLGGWVGG